MASLLIVDDDIDSTDVLAQLLRMEGHDVRVGYNGQDGLRLATEQSPQLALLDVEMPLLDGPGMAYEMFLHDVGLEHVPVIFLSGSPDLRRIAAIVGTPYFLSKPYSYQQIVALTLRALAERTAPRWASSTSGR